MSAFTFYNPVKLLFGRGRINQISLECPADAIERIMLVTDPDSGRLSGALDAVRAELADRELFLFDEVMENPSYDIVDQGAAQASDNDIELVIGIGGGSAMDAAKGIALASRQSRPIRDYVEGRELDDLPLPIICIPTTAGTGSEVTPFAVFTDQNKHIKTGYESNLIYPILSIVDPVFCDSMPRVLALHTGLDVLTHAVEAYLSTVCNPMADALALSALHAVVRHLDKALNGEQDARDTMARASSQAGLAISQKSTILLHIMAYPLTHHHKLPHGLANGLLLPAVMEFLKAKGNCPEKLQCIEDAFQSRGGMRKYLEELGLVLSLNSHGISAREFSLWAEQTLRKGDIAITPAELDLESIISIYRSAL